MHCTVHVHAVAVRASLAMCVEQHALAGAVCGKHGGRSESRGGALQKRDAPTITPKKENTCMCKALPCLKMIAYGDSAVKVGAACYSGSDNGGDYSLTRKRKKQREWPLSVHVCQSSAVTWPSDTRRSLHDCAGCDVAIRRKALAA